MSSQPGSVSLEKLVALCKRRGFVYQSAEIYGGLNGVYDFGYLGTLLKKELRAAWTYHMNQSGHDILQFEGALLAPEAVWVASGHVENFHDPMIDCLTCKKRYRADDITEGQGCPHCGARTWTDVRQFNMMFKTELGAVADGSSFAYLRPETAQAIFVSFKNIMSTNRVQIPFGVMQIGKAFRNEITPKQFLFRMREFEQMEMEFFCKPDQASSFYTQWCELRRDFYAKIGITDHKLRLREHEAHERSHYSKQTADVEYHFPFGWKELEGIAYRGDYDLTQHAQHSKKDLSVFDAVSNTKYIPHVVETSVGADRLFLTTLFDAYNEEMVEGQERIVLRFSPRIAPIKAAFLPLSKDHIAPCHELYKKVVRETGLQLDFDESGSIGKRYRRQDEIGTPVCYTFDFDSVAQGTVTARNRDSMTQERISVEKITDHLRNLIA